MSRSRRSFKKEYVGWNEGDELRDENGGWRSCVRVGCWVVTPSASILALVPKTWCIINGETAPHRRCPSSLTRVRFTLTESSIRFRLITVAARTCDRLVVVVVVKMLVVGPRVQRIAPDPILPFAHYAAVSDVIPPPTTPPPHALCVYILLT